MARLAYPLGESGSTREAEPGEDSYYKESAYMIVGAEVDGQVDLGGKIKNRWGPQRHRLKL